MASTMLTEADDSKFICQLNNQPSQVPASLLPAHWFDQSLPGVRCDHIRRNREYLDVRKGSPAMGRT